MLTNDTVIAETGKCRIPKVVIGRARRILTSADLVDGALSRVGQTVVGVVAWLADADGGGALAGEGYFAVS